MHNRPALMHMTYALMALTFILALQASALIAFVFVVASVLTLLI